MIGRGAFAQVLIAKLKNNKSTQSIPYVVKIIDKEQFKYKRKALRQFEQEISILMLLEKHVRYYFTAIICIDLINLA